MRFDQMTKEQRTELARRGGRVAHARGTGRQWTTEQARDAALKSVAIRAGRKAGHAENYPSLRCPNTLTAFDGPEAV